MFNDQIREKSSVVRFPSVYTDPHVWLHNAERIGGEAMSTNVRIIEFTKIKLRDPVLIQGLPGLGFVGKVSVDYFIDQLKPVKLAELYSTYLTLPDGDLGVEVDYGGDFFLPKYEFYVYTEGQQNIILLTGNCQPRVWGQYEVANTILDFIDNFGCKTVIALGGYATRLPQELGSVYAIANDPKIVEELRKYDVHTAKSGAVKGAFGVVMGLGKQRGMRCFGLLGATAGIYPDLMASKAVIGVITRKFNLPIDMRNLDTEIANMEVKIRRLQEIEAGLPRRRGEKKIKSPTDYIT